MKKLNRKIVVKTLMFGLMVIANMALIFASSKINIAKASGISPAVNRNWQREQDEKKKAQDEQDHRTARFLSSNNQNYNSRALISRDDLPQGHNFVNLKREIRPFLLGDDTSSLSEIDGNVVSITFLNLPLDGLLSKTSPPGGDPEISITQTLRSLLLLDTSAAPVSVPYEITAMSSNYVNNFFAAPELVSEKDYESYGSLLQTPIRCV